MKLQIRPNFDPEIKGNSNTKSPNPFKKKPLLKRSSISQKYVKGNWTKLPELAEETQNLYNN